jgi:2'-5' RNA ligase
MPRAPKSTRNAKPRADPLFRRKRCDGVRMVSSPLPDGYGGHGAGGRRLAEPVSSRNPDAAKPLGGILTEGGTAGMLHPFVSVPAAVSRPFGLSCTLETNERMRLFVALDLPWPLRERLAQLAIGLPGARWMTAENLHITLRFIGEVPNWRAEEIDLALHAIKARSFPLVVTGMGLFEKSGRVTALWAGIERSPQLEHLQTKVETALQRAGLEPERRRFTPHVTLARLDQPVNEKITRFVQGNNLFRAESFLVEHFTLFSSQLGKEGSVYTAESDYTFS